MTRSRRKKYLRAACFLAVSQLEQVGHLGVFEGEAGVLTTALNHIRVVKIFYRTHREQIKTGEPQVKSLNGVVRCRNGPGFGRPLRDLLQSQLGTTAEQQPLAQHFAKPGYWSTSLAMPCGLSFPLSYSRIHWNWCLLGIGLGFSS